jgi:hypothetical protein
VLVIAGFDAFYKYHVWQNHLHFKQQKIQNETAMSLLMYIIQSGRNCGIQQLTQEKTGLCATLLLNSRRVTARKPLI